MSTTKDTVKKDRGITTLTREKHNYEGFAVRKSRHRIKVWRYISSASGHYEGKTPSARREQALAHARDLYASVCEVIRSPRSWRATEDRPTLTKTAVARIKEIGFAIKFPA